MNNLEKKKNIKLLQGNEACAEGALLAGVRFFAGYPITPSSEIAENMAFKLPKIGGKFIQMEDEIASMAAVIGASIAGLKSLTATSGPGMCLKQENLGFAIINEIPCVVVNAQRGGPSTGLPTKPSQGDMMQARWGTHGDHPIIALAPSTVNEILTLTIKAFNLSEKYRIPVILLLDEVIAHMREKVEIPAPEDIEVINRKKPTVPPEEYLPFKPDEDGVPPMANFGEGYRYHITGLIHDHKGLPTSNSQEIDAFIRRLHNKIQKSIKDIIIYQKYSLDDANIALIAYGSVARAAERTVKLAREEGLKVGLLKLLTIWPFCFEEVNKLAQQVDLIIVPEMNLGQMVLEVERAAQGKCRVVPYGRVDGELINPIEILGKIREEIRK
ncbi:2-oxoglutarate synthase subunit alpha [Candidatus Atribacteria bacterium RBG_19FT_COMBO_35_14]|uniref:2-oxoglutarate synthase subunit alpha n=1 Tax=Candidatus Sediminicultor quintus TaxID=1797291 RepID=A0A1F5AAU9_9BACT|nr:MAG: 2-oxoglutarate synthase subunit alpha [Candidatus Atribacteria bacterium RBG_19FT_COMBO_35_14]